MRLLVIGPLNSHVSLAFQIARKLGADVASADSLSRALAHLRHTGADLVLIDVKLPVRDLVQSMALEHIMTPVMAFGTTHDANLAANAIRAGARDYLPFPPDPELIGAILASISDDETQIIARDPLTLRLIESTKKFAQSDATILVTGESGTGKEVFSRFIHAQSKRAKRPFISLNCAAIPDNLLESELFGHERGAFTGAVSRRIGKFEEAQGGTLLLDEITEMSLGLQAKLLRAIQEKTISRLGSNTQIPVDIRILATSNRQMKEAVQRKEFREDLYYRLNVISLHIPPLSERKGDIIALAENFIDKHCSANGLKRKSISKSVADQLLAYHWPGNVRELDNMIHRSVLMSQRDELEIELSSYQMETKHQNGETVTLHASAATSRLIAQCVGQTINDVERDLILSTLDACHGNRTHAARILGISIRTLRNKLHAYVDNGDITHDALKAAS